MVTQQQQQQAAAAAAASLAGFQAAGFKQGPPYGHAQPGLPMLGSQQAQSQAQGPAGGLYPGGLRTQPTAYGQRQVPAS